LKSLLPILCIAVEAALTSSVKHHILCPIAVFSTNAGPKRESGANPELPRSGEWERPMPLALNRLTRQRLGKRHAVGNGRYMPHARESEDLPRSSSREGVLFGSGALAGGATGMLVPAGHARLSFRRLFIAGSGCSGEQRPADGSDARMNRAIEPSVALLFRVARDYVEETSQ
jgi:hypothetical protein